MTPFPTRISATCLIVAIALSWPSAVAASLVKAVILNGHGAWPAFAPALAISAVVSAGVAWTVWPSARAASGLWGLYGILLMFPMCSIWAALGELARPNARFADAAAASIGILLFAAPIAIILGLLVGGDIAAVLGLMARERDRKGIEWGWFVGSAAMGLHFLAAIGLVAVYRVWE